MRRRAAGISLLELIVYTGLLALLVGALYGVVVLGLHAGHQQEVANDLQNGAQTVMDSVTRELTQSTVLPHGVTISPNGIVFISATAANGVFTLDPAGSGLPYWQQWVCYYFQPVDFDAGLNTWIGNVYRQTDTTGLPTLTVPTLPPSISTITASGAADRRLVGSHVSEFAFVQPLAGGREIDVSLTVTERAAIAVSTTNANVQSYRLSRAVSLRN